jgi:hypothetical protein
VQAAVEHGASCTRTCSREVPKQACDTMHSTQLQLIRQPARNHLHSHQLQLQIRQQARGRLDFWTGTTTNGQRT